MVSTRLVAAFSLSTFLIALAAWAGPTSHALELSREGTAYFVDLDQNRLLKLEGVERLLR